MLIDITIDVCMVWKFCGINRPGNPSPAAQHRSTKTFWFFASCGRQPCACFVTPTDAGAMLFNYDVTVWKLAK